MALAPLVYSRRMTAPYEEGGREGGREGGLSR